MTPTLIGYFPKRTMKRPDWLKSSGVLEVCSVSSCVSQAPEGWIERWQHNELWVYDTEELAWNVVPGGEGNRQFELYAYRMFPVRFVEGQQEPFQIPRLNTQPWVSSFSRLGYDAVSRSVGTGFECSPLSCNYMAEHVVVNQ